MNMNIPPLIRKALLLWPIAALWSGPMPATGQPAAAQRPAVVELYTSQGCNSCPPADALLAELAHDPRVLALGFHVDYWNSLGWEDKFALPYAFQRQSDYARSLRLASVFTPQIIIDGQLSYVGSDRSSIMRAVGRRRDGVPMEVSRRGPDLIIDVGATAARGTADVILVSYLPEAVTAIGRGENAGRTLREFNIVRATQLLGVWRGNAARYTVREALLPSDATSVAILVQEAGQRSILGAVTFPLR